MRISRVYFPRQLTTNASLTLEGETAHYLSHVLRLRVGDKFALFNGEQGEFEARVSAISKREVEVQLETLRVEPHQPGLQVHLAVGLSRGDRMDYAIQKSTELGVSEITPLYSQHGEVRLKADRLENKLRHWQRIAISACEQSGRLEVPEIHQPCEISDWLATNSAESNLLLDPNGGDKISQGPKANSINLVTGPEGGFSQQELTLAKASGYTVVGLGSRVLRTETAPVAALAILQHLYGDM